MAGIVVVFDFDKTIIDCDSDLPRHRPFQPPPSHHALELPHDRMMVELHSKGKTIQDIADCLKTAPLDPNVISAVKAAYALGCDLRVVSDANSFFIETILEHHGLIGYFSEINTNPSYMDDEGRLRILPYHDFTTNSHGCDLCPPNMCKGKIIERIQSSSGKKRLIYLGDGKGDYCPSLKLSEGDYMMPRKNFPVWDLISQNPGLLNAEVHEWRDFEEQGRALLQLISKSMAGDHSEQLVALDCKFETTILSHETLLRPLPIRQ